MVSWQKKVQNIIVGIGKEVNYDVSIKEELFSIRSEKRFEDYNSKKRILDYQIRPDGIWRKGKRIKFHFEIEPKANKYLIGTIVNGLIFSIEMNSILILIVETKKQAEDSWDIIRLLEMKFDIKLKNDYYVYYFDDNNKIKLKEKIFNDFKEDLLI